MGKVAGGFKISDKIGNARQMKKFTEYCKKQGIDSYADFEIMRYNRGGKGFSTFADNATTAGEQKAYKYAYGKTTRIENRWDIYYLLSPYRFVDAAKKVCKKTDGWGFSGVSLSSLANVSYADYSSKTDSKYFSRDGISKTVRSAIKAARGDKKYMSASSNLYAATVSDIVVEAPIDSAEVISFTEQIPFYQMVLKGFVPMTSESINLVDNRQKALLRAVEGGIGISFTVIDSWDVTLIDAQYPYFYSSVYDDLRDGILSDAKRIDSYIDAIKGSTITAHKILENGVRATEFSNGVCAYINYSDAPQSTPAGEIAALDFEFTGGAE
jgi:hypothetical protein